MTTSARAKTRQNLEDMVRGAAASVKVVRDDSSGQLLTPDLVGKLELAIQKGRGGRTIQELPIHLIKTDENLRLCMDPDSLAGLAESIKRDGLIHHPTVLLRKTDSGAELVCSNGHRRIAAAKELGWTRIECSVQMFQDELSRAYFLLNANMAENVHFLDLAKGYSEVARFEQTDREIATRVGLNPRTVMQYRRLSEFSMACEQLVRGKPKLFTSTWCISLARQAPLRNFANLLDEMRAMVAKNRTWVPEAVEKAKPRGRAVPSQEEGESGLAKLRQYLGGPEGAERKAVARELLDLFVGAKLVSGAGSKKVKALLG